MPGDSVQPVVESITPVATVSEILD